MKQVIVIPARYQSSRLPGKPLIDLLGVSMIKRTYARCLKAFPGDSVYVATDDERILAHCREHGMQVVMTPGDCLTGTDRVAWVAGRIPADLYINVQGDEPLMEPADILAVSEAARRHPGEVINGMAEIGEEELFRSGSIPKVVARPDGRLLYMSRGAIPTTKTLGFVRAWRQICVYGFPAEALAAFASASEKTELEAIEDIEILRFLELGFEVRMIPLSDRSIAVDCPEDVKKVEAALVARGLIEL